MKKLLSLSFAIGLLLVIGTCFSALAQPFPWCTDTPEYCQKKVAQVPIPWQFWGIITDPSGATTVIDRIRISPTWLNPPPAQPPGTAPVFVQRLVATSTAPIPLDGLVWDFRTGFPQPLDLEWELKDSAPIEVIAGQDVELAILIDPLDPPAAVLVAYEVFLDADGLNSVGHFINEAILESQSPSTIVEIRVNFDMHNETGLDVTNFELDFHGLNFGCNDVLGAIGFIAAEGIPPVPVIPPVIWGANPGNPLVVRPIPDGTEVKWIQPDRPLHDCEWLHVGLAFDCMGFDCFNDDPLGATVQGYWTVIEPCPEPGVYVDIKPGSCPNPFNVNSKGVLPVAILGTEDLDATTIDPATVKIAREGIDVSPLRWSYEDVATPFEGELCECHELNGDGYLDLKLKFHRREVAETLKLWQVLGQTIPFTITGNLKEEYGGTAFSGQDCMWIKPKVKGKAKLEPVGESGVYGKAKLVTRTDGTTKVGLKKFTGLTPGGTYQATVRSGSCDGVILFNLSDVIVDEEGVGRSVTIVDATIDFDTWWIEVGGLTCGKVKLR